MISCPDTDIDPKKLLIKKSVITVAQMESDFSFSSWAEGIYLLLKYREKSITELVFVNIYSPDISTTGLRVAAAL